MFKESGFKPKFDKIESTEPILEKDQAWDKMRKEVEKLEDALGEKIEQNIIETVIALRLNNFSTFQSCGGHPKTETGTPYPWVIIQKEEPEKWQENESVLNEWKEENEKQQRVMKETLDRFYKDRKVEENIKLKIVQQGIFGSFRLQSFDSLDDDKESDELLIERRREMKIFTEYLKNNLKTNKNEPTTSSRHNTGRV